MSLSESPFQCLFQHIPLNVPSDVSPNAYKRTDLDCSNFAPLFNELPQTPTGSRRLPVECNQNLVTRLLSADRKLASGFQSLEQFVSHKSLKSKSFWVERVLKRKRSNVSKFRPPKSSDRQFPNNKTFMSKFFMMKIFDRSSWSTGDNLCGCNLYVQLVFAPEWTYLEVPSSTAQTTGSNSLSKTV